MKTSIDTIDVGYMIGASLIAFGLAVFYQIFSALSVGMQNVYYPFLGVVLLITGASVCYGYKPAAHIIHS